MIVCCDQQLRICFSDDNTGTTALYFLFLLPFLPMSFLWLMVCFNCYPVIQKLVINPYYEQRGEENPELRYTSPSNPEESICVDQGGKEKPIEPKKKPKRGKTIS